jgi:hypothetical protein
MYPPRYLRNQNLFCTFSVPISLFPVDSMYCSVQPPMVALVALRVVEVRLALSALYYWQQEKKGSVYTMK